MATAYVSMNQHHIGYAQPIKSGLLNQERVCDTQQQSLYKLHQRHKQ
jgi:hypothetical protein